MPAGAPVAAGAAGGPLFRCGRCLRPVEPDGVGRRVVCAGCGRRLAIPARVRLRCQRCQQPNRLRPQQLGRQARCACCGWELAGRQVLLPAAGRRRGNPWLTCPARRSPHDQAVSLMLLVGLALLAALLLFSRA